MGPLATSSRNRGHLANEDPVLATLSTRHSQADPFKWDVYDRTGEDRFRVLAFLTIGQVVTQRVAAEQYDNLTRIADEPLGADGVIRLATDGLTDAGIAKFKVTAHLALASAIIEDRIDLDELDELEDEETCHLLTAIPGIGRWAVELILIRGLQRPDVLPASDHGIKRAIQRAWGLPALSGAAETDAPADCWRPYRSFAAALMWASLST